MILRAIGAFAVSVPVGGILAGVITALAGVREPLFGLVMIPIVFIALMVMTR
jgi:hypothetical protein